MLQYKGFDLFMDADNHEWSLHQWHKSCENQTGFHCSTNIIKAMNVEHICHIALVQPEEPRIIDKSTIVYNKMKLLHLITWLDEDAQALKEFVQKVTDSLAGLVPNPVITATAYPVIADIWNIAEMTASKAISSMDSKSIEEKASVYTRAYYESIQHFHNWVVERKFKS